jgi:hypothetical protein
MVQRISLKKSKVIGPPGRPSTGLCPINRISFSGKNPTCGNRPLSGTLKEFFSLKIVCV